MKVLQINTTFYHGGSTGKIMSGLSGAMRENSITPYIFYGVSNGEQREDNVYLMEKLLYKKVNGLKSRVLGNQGFNNKLATQRAIKLIGEIKPDIIHLHNLHGAYINIEILFKYVKENNIPVVWTLHDCWSFTGRCAHYDYNQCSMWKNGCSECKYKSQYPPAWWLDRAGDCYARKKTLYGDYEKLVFVTPSKWLRNEMSYSFLKDQVAEVINNGIDMDIYKARSSSKKSDYSIKKMVLAVAYRWCEQKGFEYLQMIADNLDEDWKMVVIGGVERAKSELTNRGIIVLDKIYDEVELAEWYSAADVLIDPTLEDTYPTVLIEAMACGTPCVSFNTGGCPEIIEDIGVIVDKRDWKSMTEAIRTSGEKKLDKDAVELVRKKYDKQRMNNDYIELYRSIFQKWSQKLGE